jgi:HTH-type transcriptional regulator / antitoxin HipB
MDRSFDLQRLGQAFRALRMNRGLTQQEVAERAGITRLTVIRIEDGRDSVSIRNHSRLAAALGAELNAVVRTRPTFEEMGAFK